jgi:hypothetical protein
MCRIPVVIIAAVVIGGAGLTACGGTGPTSSTAVSEPAAAGSVTAMATATAAGSTPASAPASTAATSAAVTHPAVTRSSATSTPPARPTASASSLTHGSSGGTVSFTVPAISGDNVVSAYGSYTKIGTAEVKVSVCAKQTGTAFAVGAVAYAYNSSGASKNVGAVVLTGPGTSSCVSMTFLSYTAHLNIHSFIGGSNGKVSKTGPTLTLY